MPKNFSPEQEFSGINLSSGFHLSKKYCPMRGIIFPISENTFRITFSIRKHTSMLNYFPNELFFSTQWHSDITQWHLKTSQEHIYFLMACFSFPMTYSGFPMFSSRKLSLSPIFIIHPNTRTTISGSQKQKKQTSTTASGSAVAFPFTDTVKLGNEKLTEVTFLH